MGLVFDKVIFNCRPPNPKQIVAEIRKLSGLEVSTQMALFEPEESLRRWFCDIAFSAVPESKLRMYCYYPGAVKKERINESKESGLPVNVQIEGFETTEKEQPVFLNCHIGQDETLCLVAIQALLNLGGQGAKQLKADDLLKLPIDETELIERERKLLKKEKLYFVHLILAAPVLIPIWVIDLVLFFPIRLIKAFLNYRKNVTK